MIRTTRDVDPCIPKLVPLLLSRKAKGVLVGFVHPLRSHVRGRVGSSEFHGFGQRFSSFGEGVVSGRDWVCG